MNSIFYTVAGQGPAVVLLHGFPMDHSIWRTLVTEMQTTCTVYTPDLPGVGGSPILPGNFSIEQVASHLLNWMDEIHLANTVLVGHSLGGYIALAMAASNPSRFKGLGLFHSTAYPDSVEKKESRTKTVEFIKRNGPQAFTSNFIEPLFAQPNHEAVGFVKSIAIKFSESTLLGYLLAMRDRPDHQVTLKNFAGPVLFITGDQDKGIPVSAIKAQALLCQKPELSILEGVAHMGMLEAPQNTGKLLKNFVLTCQ